MTSLESQMKAYARMTKAKALNERIQLEEMNLTREQMKPLEEIAARKQIIADLRTKLVNPKRYYEMMLARERARDEDDDAEEDVPTPEESAALVFSKYTKGKALEEGLSYEELAKWKKGNSAELMEKLADKFDMPGKERKESETANQYKDRQRRAFNKLFGIKKVSYPDNTNGNVTITPTSGSPVTLDGSLYNTFTAKNPKKK